MTLDDFLNNFFCNCNIQNINNLSIVITSNAIRRINNSTVDSVTTTIDIQESNNWITDSQTSISLNEWNWEQLLDQVKRLHLSHFAQRASIENYFPLNSNDIPDISNMYV
jgi:hypothetical protein